LTIFTDLLISSLSLGRTNPPPELTEDIKEIDNDVDVLPRSRCEHERASAACNSNNRIMCDIDVDTAEGVGRDPRKVRRSSREVGLCTSLFELEPEETEITKS